MCLQVYYIMSVCMSIMCVVWVVCGFFVCFFVLFLLLFLKKEQMYSLKVKLVSGIGIYCKSKLVMESYIYLCS